MTKAALLLIDIQEDFLPPNGALGVSGGREILPIVHKLLDEGKWDLVVASQDYHPSAHISFASRHSRQPFTDLQLPHPTIPNETYVQELWPDHCIQGSWGSEIEPSVAERVARWEAKGKGKVVRKGEHVDCDEYSAFQGSANEGVLAGWLAEAGIDELFIAGLATDFCVRFSASEAVRDLKGVAVHLVVDAMRGVDPAKGQEALRELESKGAKLVESDSEEVRRWLS